VARDYASFVHHTPWYEFPFGSKLGGLWRLPPLGGIDTLRKWERRFAGTGDLAFKTGWGWLMGKASGAAYDPEAERILAWVKKPAGEKRSLDPTLKALEPPDADSELVAIPRYEPFTKAVGALARQGVQFIEIAGNRTIVMTVIAPGDWRNVQDPARVVHEWEILTKPSKKRVAIATPVDRLHQLIPALESQGVELDHIYDY
jgi:hypothetical protein